MTAVPPVLRHRIEHWFVRRGVPQLIAGYSSEPAMDARAAPFISAWFVAGTILFWGTRPDWPAAWNGAGVVATVAWMSVVWTLVTRLRGRRLWSRPARFDLRDIVTFGLLPVLPAALIDGSVREGFTAFFGALAGIGVIYLLIGFGLVEIGAWALQRLALQLAHIVELMSRTLPLLLILVVFLLFAAEIWEAAHTMSAAELGAVLVLLLLVAALLVVTSFRPELRRLETRPDADGILVDAAGTPAADAIPLLPDAAAAVLRVPPLTPLQRFNVTLLVLIEQLLQAVFVAVIVMAFLVLFGLVVLPGSVQSGWIGDAPRALGAFDLLGETRLVSAELVIVSTMLGGIVGLYFTGLAITDPSYRAGQFDRAIAEVRELLAARAVYVAALESGSGSG